MALGDKAGLEAVEKLLPEIRAFNAKLDAVLAELQAIRRDIEQKQVVIRMEDK